jgi:SHS family lactate transporter-like MFS transporter
LPALLALFVRYRVKESEVWRRMRHKSWRELGHAILSHWKLFLYLTLLMTTMACVSHGTQDMYPTFLERQRGFGPSGRAAVTAISMIGAIFGGLFFGFFSDRFGRRSAMIAALLTGICVIPIWIFAPSTGLLVTGAILMQFMVQGAELSPDSMRGFLPGFAYQCGVLLASSVAYLEAVFAQRTRYSTAMALTVLIVLFTAAAVTALGREQHGIEFGIKKEELTRS